MRRNNCLKYIHEREIFAKNSCFRKKNWNKYKITNYTLASLLNMQAPNYEQLTEYHTEDGSEDYRENNPAGVIANHMGEEVFEDAPEETKAGDNVVEVLMGLEHHNNAPEASFLEEKTLKGVLGLAVECPLVSQKASNVGIRHVIGGCTSSATKRGADGIRWHCLPRKKLRVQKDATRGLRSCWCKK